MSLLLHCGAEEISEADLRKLRVPEATRSHVPIAHHTLVEQLEQQLADSPVEIIEKKHSVTSDASRYFGMFKLNTRQQAGGLSYNMLVGMRNAHDKAFTASLAMGAYVMVCDNLSFSGEVVVARKHTRYILRDLPALFSKAFGKILESEQHQQKRFNAYVDQSMEDISRVHDFVVRSVDNKVIPNAKIPHVLKQWRNDTLAERQRTEEEGVDPTLWNLFNVYTDVLKSVGNLQDLPRRTQALHGMCDTLCGVLS